MHSASSARKPSIYCKGRPCSSRLSTASYSKNSAGLATSSTRFAAISLSTAALAPNLDRSPATRTEVSITMRICSQRTAQRCCYRERFSRHLCEGWTLTAKGFKERGLAFLIGDAGARTIIHQKSAQILRSGLTLGQGGRRGRKRTKADGFGLQYLPPQDLFDHRFLRWRQRLSTQNHRQSAFRAGQLYRWPTEIIVC